MRAEWQVLLWYPSGDVEEIKGITRNEDGDILIGAGTVFSHITADPIIQKYIPVLGEAVDQVGGPQIRNIGTIGGNICNGAVSADSVPTVFSYNSLLHIANEDGGRIAPVREFYLGPGRVDLHPGEVLTHVVIPKKNMQDITDTILNIRCEMQWILQR